MGAKGISAHLNRILHYLTCITALSFLTCYFNRLRPSCFTFQLSELPDPYSNSLTSSWPFQQAETQLLQPKTIQDELFVCPLFSLYLTG